MNKKSNLKIGMYIAGLVTLYEAYFLLTDPRASNLAVIIVILAGLVTYLFYYLNQN